MFNILKSDPSDAIKLLKSWREENLRRSQDVVELYQNHLEKYMSKFGNEIVIAALDIGRYDIASVCFHKLEKRFPNSMRVAKLFGYLLESQEKFDEALELYDTLLNKDPTNSLIYKRKITVLKEQNKIIQAIQEMNEYLKIFMSDIEAWHELCDLYLAIVEYDKAAFCMEELLLSNSRNYFYHLKYAEIKYSQGGNENLEIARCHYCFSYKLNHNNLRVLYGIALVSSTLLNSSKGSTPKKIKENQICYDWATNQINRLYSKRLKDDSNEIETLKIVTKSLNSLQVT